MDYVQLFKEWFFYFLKQHGIVKTLKGIILYHYRIIKLLKIDVSKEHTVITNNCPLILIPHDKGISEELLLFGTHEPLSTKALQMELKQEMICLDIGANIGYYATMESHSVGKSGRVIAIEPFPINFSFLKRNMDLQKTSNYEVHNFAIGNVESEINFLISKKSNLSRVVQEGEKIPDGCELIRIPLKSIDKLVEEKKLEKLDLLRMDVEGYELQILEGSRNTIRKFKPMIQIEIHTKILGPKNLKKVLNDLKNFEYEIKYYVPREIDFPILGSDKDIQVVTFEQLIKETDENKLPKNFILLIK